MAGSTSILVLCRPSDALLCTVQGRFQDTADAAARIFVWLRYSSARKLTWQRNYNTQPRILGEAQSRLTHAIGEVCLCCRASHPLLADWQSDVWLCRLAIEPPMVTLLQRAHVQGRAWRQHCAATDSSISVQSHLIH